MTVYESEVCRVWTGPLGTSLHAIEDAEQQQLDVVPCALQIWLNSRPSIESSSAQSSEQQGLYLTHSLEARDPVGSFRSILLSREALSCFSIYSPSPFVSSVLVVLDVDDQWQQGYFFGRVRRVAVKSELNGSKSQPSDQSDAFFHTEAAEELLSVLHAAFPEVSMSNSAKECLTKQSASLHLSGTGIGEMTKRRKTLSAKAFYGSGGNNTSVSDGWRAFYDKLQFRVSHSLMCQLEGTAAISSSFPRQQEAFEFADQVAALRLRLLSTREPAQKAGCNSDLVPRVFSFESAGDGKRRFLVTNFNEFWKNYKKTRTDQRHVYEIIREGVPCRLYFDLEFKRSINPHADSDGLVARLISLLQLQLYRRYGIYVRHQDIYQLDSSTPAKFSRHLIFHFPHGDLFADNIHAGAFVREFISDFVANDDFKDAFLVNTISTEDHIDQKQLFIDTGVYTRNRMFRVMGSSKHKKEAVLRPLNASTSSPLDQDLFVSTLVCPYPSLEAFQIHQQTKSCRLLRCRLSSAAAGRTRRFTNAASSSKNLTSSSVECRKSIYPALDAFIRSQATTGGVQGEIRAIQMLMTNNAAALAVLPGQESDRDNTEDPQEATSYPWMLIYHMARNRWCANVRRPHKSNNVMFIVDIDQRVFYQKCHDPMCQAIDFRSPPQSLPPTMKLSAKTS